MVIQRYQLSFLEEALGSNPQSNSLFGDYIASKAPDEPSRKEEISEAESAAEARSELAQAETSGTTIFASWPRSRVLAQPFVKAHLLDRESLFLQMPEPRVQQMRERRNNKKGTPSLYVSAEDREDLNEPRYYGIYNYLIKGFFKDACSALRTADDTLSSDITSHKKKIDGQIFIQPRFIPFIAPSPEMAALGLCERPLRADTPQGPRVALVRSETVPIGTMLEFDIQVLSESLLPLVAEWMAYGPLRGLGQWRNSGKGQFMATLLSDSSQTEEAKAAKAARKIKSDAKEAKKAAK